MTLSLSTPLTKLYCHPKIVSIKRNKSHGANIMARRTKKQAEITLEQYKEVISNKLFNYINDGVIDCNSVEILIENFLEKQEKKENKVTGTDEKFQDILEFIQNYNCNQSEGTKRIFISGKLINSIHPMSGETRKRLFEKYADTIESHHTNHEISCMNQFYITPQIKQALKQMYAEWLNNDKDSTIFQNDISTYF